jgi:hypothetical protein
LGVATDVDGRGDVGAAGVVGRTAGAEVGAADAASSRSRERITAFAIVPRVRAVISNIMTTALHCFLDTQSP